MKKVRTSFVCSLIFCMVIFAGFAFADDYGNSCSSATSVSLNSTRSGSIETAGDYDYFRVNVTTSGTLTVYTTGSTDTYGYLKNSSCSDLASNDDSSGSNFGITRSVSAGTYYVAVKHYRSSGRGAYTLNVTFTGPVTPSPDDHGNSCSTATAVSVNSTCSGNIETVGDYDYFSVNVTSGTLSVYTTGSTDTYGYLKNSACSDLASDDDSGGSNFDITQYVTAGTYYVAVKHYSSGTGTYTLNVNFNSCPNEPTTVSLGSSTSGRIETAGDSDFFRFYVPSYGTLTIYTAGSTNTYGYLGDSPCDFLGEDDDSGSSLNFSIVRFVSPGTYYVRVDHALGGTGSYTLYVNFQ